MRLQIFSDLHHDVAALDRLLAVEADYYIAAGDMVNWSRGLDAIGERLRMRAGRVYVLPGNHENAATIETFCEKYGLNPLHKRSFQAEGWHIAGLGHSTPTPFDTPGEWTESQFVEALHPFEDMSPLIWVCHCPPYGTPLDEAMPGRHFGSKALGAFIQRVRPRWFFCGHIHEAAGRRVELGTTTAVNVGKQGFLLEVAAVDAQPE